MDFIGLLGGSCFFGDIFRDGLVITQAKDKYDSDEAFVPVVFAGDKSEAGFYKSLLDDYGLKVQIEGDIFDEDGTFPRPKVDYEGLRDEGEGIAVLVPQGDLSGAQDIIARNSRAEDEFDEEFDDDDDDNYDGFGEIDPDQD